MHVLQNRSYCRSKFRIAKIGILDHLLVLVTILLLMWPWSWPDDLHIRIWSVFPGYAKMNMLVHQGFQTGYANMNFHKPPASTLSAQIKIEFLPSRELGGEQGAALTTYPHKLSPIFGVLAMGVHLLLGTPMSSCNWTLLSTFLSPDLSTSR